ncbi:hypothetical protein SAQ01S_07030 [Sphingomonas aquatilis NBRC 16722]|uniref:Uncharacterized protein n=1 Tax=Sphingomonas aquatilis TaxID=93063 RepID=A0AAW3TVL6_9SPHN|nr:hypothetical protein [Sphingomonas aquatilis]MBB3876085.1 hypothetical protein [Sphingomonas aquatilis]GEM70937.1 hypothetical protein SAQ01S_07030 [Sphingomonas aquatilis NBRC 16722]
MQRFTHDGVVYEETGDGQVRVVGYADAPAAPQGGVFSLPQDPTKQAMGAAQLDKLKGDLSRAPYENRQAAANATKAEVDAEKARRDLAAQQATATPQQQQAMAALGNDEILSAIAKARDNLNRTGAAGFAARLPELLQPQSTIDLAGSLNTIASRLTLDKLAQLKTASPTGASGLGLLTEKEGALLRDSVAGLGQTQSPDQLRENLAAVERHYRNFMALSKGEDYRDPKVAEKYGIAVAPQGGSQGEQLAFATGDTRTEADPALAGVNSHIRGMIGAGKSQADIVAYMNSVQPGLGDQRAGDVGAAVRFRAQNPRVPLSQYAVSVENRSVPMSGLRQTINQYGQGAAGAYVGQALDALSAGTIDNMTDNPALTRAAMSTLAERNPTAALLGTLSGGALAGAGAEAGLGGMALGRFAPLAADALYGAAYGAGSADEGSRLGGAAQGALTGVVGGVAGRRLTGMFGRALTGVRDEAQQYLRSVGVPLTPGQALGGRFKAREDRLAGFGGIGDAIGARRMEGVQAMNRAAWDQALAPIGRQANNQLGEAAVEQADDAVGQAYQQALGSVRLQRDRPFGIDMQGPATAANRLPGEMGANARYTLNERVGNSFDPNGVMTGNNFQQAVRGLEQDARAVRNAPYGNDFGNVTRGARGALENLLDRQAPGALPAYLDANAAYRNTSVLADATAAAMNTGGVFTGAQLGQAARANARRFTGRMSAATTDRPFFDLQRAAQEVLPSRVPDSGTAGRIEAGGGLMTRLGAAARNTALAPLYAESTQPAINRLLLDRPDALVAIGEQVAQRRRLGGMFGRPLALAYSPIAVTSDY